MGSKTASKLSNVFDTFDVLGTRKAHKAGVKARHESRVADDATAAANLRAADEQAKRDDAARVAQEEEQKKKQQLAQQEQSNRLALTNFLAAEQAEKSNRRFLTGAK